MAGALNSFEGGSNTVSVTAGNSGGASGDAFSSAAGVTYSTEQAAHGLVAGRTATGVTGTVTHALTGSGVRWARVYVHFSPTGGPGDIMWLNMGGFLNGYFVAYTAAAGSAELRALVNGSIVTLQSAAASLAGQWIRVELQATSLASGAAEARFYTGDATTPMLTLSGAALRAANTWSSVDYGGSNSFLVRYIDDVGWSDTDWLGPAATKVPQPIRPIPQAHQRASRW
jgi:hypothetical protein